MSLVFFKHSLLEKFPVESGQLDPNQRVIPFLPGITMRAFCCVISRLFLSQRSDNLFIVLSKEEWYYLILGVLISFSFYNTAQYCKLSHMQASIALPMQSKPRSLPWNFKSLIKKFCVFFFSIYFNVFGERVYKLSFQLQEKYILAAVKCGM